MRRRSGCRWRRGGGTSRGCTEVISCPGHRAHKTRAPMNARSFTERILCTQCSIKSDSYLGSGRAAVRPNRAILAPRTVGSRQRGDLRGALVGRTATVQKSSVIVSQRLYISLATPSRERPSHGCTPPSHLSPKAFPHRLGRDTPCLWQGRCQDRTRQPVSPPRR